jgi:beta-fructofuranosidase
MKKRPYIISILLLTLMAAGCGSAKQEEGLVIFPRGKESWVGDPMPYYDGKDFRVFYLEDLRNGDAGFHPWSLITTNNFVKYKNEGIVIPYSKKTSEQDLALGTGSVVKDKDGLYHAFYTGHNGRKTPKEAIMHAISKDLTAWIKIPEDTFFASEQYNADDFRDPYVFYNEDYKKYWMVITTRKNNMGVITLYTSEDLKKWTDEGVLFANDMGSDSNMECPTLIKYGAYWYLTFSDQWPNRVVHYRIAKDSKGPFNKPALDYFDGNGFYAGRMEKDSKNLYMFGWTPTKEKYDDAKNYDWAGNLVVHQIKQKENGELYPVPVETIDKKINNKTKLELLTQSETVKVSRGDYSFSGKGYETVTFDNLQGLNKITGKISTKSQNNKFGFMFNLGKDGNAPMNIVFDTKLDEIQFFNVSTDKIPNAKPQSTMPLKIKANDTLNFTLLIDDSVAVLYVNDQAVLSSRMFTMQKRKWGIFSIDSNVIFEDLKLSK